MVSIKRNLSLFFLKSLVFVSFMALCSAAYAVTCSSSQAQCCSGTTLTCCAHPGYDSSGNELSYDLSACMSADVELDSDFIISDDLLTPVGECTLGNVQYKPDGTCGTTSRTCCGSLVGWSDWGGECSSSSTTSCSASTKPVASQSCTTGGGGSGTQTRTVSCNTTNGEWVAGDWSTCTCSKTCSGGQVLDPGTCNCCNYECYIAINKSNYNYICNCMSGSYAMKTTCCTINNGDEFNLPAYYSSCTDFASAMGLNLDTSVIEHMCSMM